MWSKDLKQTPANQNEMEYLQIFDLLQMSQKEKHLKHIYLESLKTLKTWKKNYKNTDKDFLNFLEGFVLKHRAKKNLTTYRIFRKNRVDAFSFYMKSLPNHGQAYYQSK